MEKFNSVGPEIVNAITKRKLTYQTGTLLASHKELINWLKGGAVVEVIKQEQAVHEETSKAVTILTFKVYITNDTKDGKNN
jgi:pyridoxal biosynthesis lyase PdxS